jgi:ribosomal protein L12E/L44/L45/RPP1/RPP2
MLGDAVSAKKSSGEAKESLEVVDVAQLLARSVRQPATVAVAGPSAAEQAGGDAERGASANGKPAEPGAARPGSTGPDPG